MPTCFSALMCHAPIVLPEVGGAETRRCARTTRAMQELARRAVDSAPDRLVLISPHSPRHRVRYGAWRGRHVGDLGDFRAPQLAVSLPNAPEVFDTLDLAVVKGKGPGWLDHGAMVPLAFLWQAGWRGKTAIIALPWAPGPDAEGLGAQLAELPGRTAVIASGDMSHRLKRGAPAGYHPDAQTFDDSFVAALRRDDWAAAVAAPCRDVAAEDVVESVRVAMGACPGPTNAEVIAYEGPWGVGYTEAVLYDPAPALHAIARRAVRAAVTGAPLPIPAGGPASAGAFVTITKDGQLRGCLGHMTAAHDRLYAEVAHVAKASALRDPRFPPVSPVELESLDFEISVLEPPEPVADASALDVREYGLVVSWRDRRGVLLPDLEGVDSVEQQIAICRRKGEIPEGVPVDLERFRVRKAGRP